MEEKKLGGPLSPHRRALRLAVGARRLVAPLAVAVLLTIIGATAGALDLTGGPVVNLPLGSSCSTSGTLARGSGVTVTCTITSPENYADVYFGVANNSSVNGQAMDGSGPSSYEVFRYSGSTASSIIYTSSTTMDNVLGSSAQNINTRLVLTLVSGTGVVLDTGGTPADNSNGDIQKLFRITGSTFSIRIEAQSNTPPIPVFGESNPTVYDATHTPENTRTSTGVSLAFYYNGCGA